MEDRKFGVRADGTTPRSRPARRGEGRPRRKEVKFTIVLDIETGHGRISTGYESHSIDIGSIDSWLYRYMMGGI